MPNYRSLLDEFWAIFFGKKCAERPKILPKWARCYDFFSSKQSAKKLAIFIQNEAKLHKDLIITLVFEKNANFLQKIGKNSRKM
jgi:hypothetical protein